MADEKYYLNNKLYNISKSVKLYEYTVEEPSGIFFLGQYPLTREVTNRVYISPKGNLFKTTVREKKISITDVSNDEFKELLLRKNELDILERLYPLEYQKLEEY